MYHLKCFHQVILVKSLRELWEMADWLELREAWGKRFDRTIIPCIVLTISAISIY